MSIKEFLFLEKLSVGIISVTAGLILFLGAIIYGSMISSNPYRHLQAKKVPTHEGRTPASVENLSQEIQRVVLGSSDRDQAQATFIIQSEVVSLDCFNSSSPVKVLSQAKQVRLRGPICGKGAISNLEVVNRTNGFVATIFEIEKFRYSSDYIQLSQGENQILLSYRDMEGTQHASEIVISRDQ